MRSFTYRFDTGDEQFEYTHSHENAPVVEAELPDWTRLDYHQCQGCRWFESERCPVAVRLIEPSGLLSKLRSFDTVTVTVTAPERTYSKETTAQEALSSLFGLVMATSGCPSFTLLKGLAWYHLPFASYEETLFRALSGYFIYNYVSGKSPSPEQTIAEIKAFYEQVGNTNRGISTRLREGVAPQTDSPMNAIVLLDSFGALVSLSAEDGLDELRKTFLKP